MKIIFISILFFGYWMTKKNPDLSIGLSNNFILFKWYFFPLFLNWKISIFKFQFYFSYHLIHFFICCCLSLHRNMMINSKSTVGIIFFPILMMMMMMSWWLKCVYVWKTFVLKRKREREKKIIVCSIINDVTTSPHVIFFKQTKDFHPFFTSP